MLFMSRIEDRTNSRSHVSSPVQLCCEEIRFKPTLPSICLDVQCDIRRSTMAEETVSVTKEQQKIERLTVVWQFLTREKEKRVST